MSSSDVERSLQQEMAHVIESHGESFLTDAGVDLGVCESAANQILDLLSSKVRSASPDPSGPDASAPHVAIVVRVSHGRIAETVGLLRLLFGERASIEADCGHPWFAMVAFTPRAIRDHFDGDEEHSARLASISDPALYRAAVEHLSQDLIWDQFHEHCLEILRSAEQRSVECPDSPGAS